MDDIKIGDIVKETGDDYSRIGTVVELDPHKIMRLHNPCCYVIVRGDVLKMGCDENHKPIKREIVERIKRYMRQGS